MNDGMKGYISRMVVGYNRENGICAGYSQKSADTFSAEMRAARHGAYAAEEFYKAKSEHIFDCWEPHEKQRDQFGAELHGVFTALKMLGYSVRTLTEQRERQLKVLTGVEIKDEHGETVYFGVFRALVNTPLICASRESGF